VNERQALSAVRVEGLYMSFRFYANAISQASKRTVLGLVAAVLALIVLGMLAYILWNLYVIVAAIRDNWEYFTL
jgi:biopolymer transport protein ExbB/TolQ